MGTVYRAREPWSGREVALKQLSRGELADDIERARFRADLRCISDMQHPNIVQVYDSEGVHDKVPYFTMQLVEGGSLDTEDNRTLFSEPRQAARLVATVARAVQFCHDAARPILHRDIKPGNLLIGHDRHPYLTDFGVAMHLGASTASRTNSRVGTLAYMAPEQIAGERLTKATDVYGLGAVLYELLTGRPPFVAPSEPELVLRIKHQEPRAPHKPWDDYKPHTRTNRDLGNICLTALTKEPAQRYRSAAALADDLERYLRGEAPLLSPASRSERLLAWVQRNWIASVAFTSLFVVLATSAITLYLVIDRQRDELIATQQKSLATLAHSHAAGATYVMEEKGQRLVAVSSALGAQVEDAVGLAAIDARFFVPYRDDFNGLTVFDLAGRAIVRYPDPLQDLGNKTFEFRDYFQNAKRLAQAHAHIAEPALAIKSEGRDSFDWGLSTPVFSKKGEPVGVLLAMIRAQESFGRLILGTRSATPGPTCAVVALRGVDRGDDEAIQKKGHKSSYAYVAHHGMTHQASKKPKDLPPAAIAELLENGYLPDSAGNRLSQSTAEDVLLPHYDDPLIRGQGSFVAAFAPIGRTGIAVLAELPESMSVRPISDLRAVLMLGFAGVAAALFLLFATLLVLVTRRRFD
jgi:serine/threonine-protein kinase